MGVAAIPERLPSIASNLHRGQIPRRQGNPIAHKSNRLETRYGQLISIYAGAIQH